MSLANFQAALRENYSRYNGPFNWLASESELGAYNYLPPSQKKLALLLIYTQYVDTISNTRDDQTSFEKICTHPTKCQEFFDLIVCASLIDDKKKKESLSLHVGDYTTPTKIRDLSYLVNQFEQFLRKIPRSEDPWIVDCMQTWGNVTLEDWINLQINFLKKKIDSYSSSNDKYGKYNDEIPCLDTLDLNALTFEKAQENLNSLVGLRDVKGSVYNTISHSFYTEARSIACNISTNPSFKNYIFSGSPGVGKTTVARCVAGLLAATNVLSRKEAVFTCASGLIGDFIGVTEKRISELFNKGRGGAIIIDEADTLAGDGFDRDKFRQSAIQTLNAMIGYEKDNNLNTVVILTGYEAGIKSLLNSNPGLRRRFPNNIIISDYGPATLKEIFIQKMKARNYTFSDKIIEIALKQILIAKEFLNNNFGNAGTVEEFIDVMEAERAQKIGIETLRKITQEGTADLNIVKLLSTVSVEEIPFFDKEISRFRTNHLNLISSQ